MTLPELNLPEMSLRLRTNNGRQEVFDPIRKKFIALTPEEWVRQHIILFLIQYKSMPTGLMGVEKGLKVHGLFRRTDVVVSGRDGKPRLIVECKAPSVKISQAVFEQIARYNLSLHASYLLVTNGLQHFCCQLDYTNNTYQFLPEVPDYRVM